MIDYRNDPKSPTGQFELIYKQIIPPAPAYLGLNLFLKGHHMMPKAMAGGGGKKDKNGSTPRRAGGATATLAALQPPRVRDLSMAYGGGGTVVSSERPMMLGVFDCIAAATDAKQQVPAVERKSGRAQTKSLMVMKKPAVLDLSSVTDAAKTLVKTKAKRPSSSTRLRAETTTRKLTTIDTVTDQRHASCGPRVTVSAATNCPPPSTIADELMSRSDVYDFLRNDIECVGSKWQQLQDAIGTSTSRVLQTQTPRLLQTVPRLAVEINKNKKCKIIGGAAENLPCKDTRSAPAINSRTISAADDHRIEKVTRLSKDDYQKYVDASFGTNKSLDNVARTTPVFAIGLNLRAWKQSKLNKTKKCQSGSTPHIVKKGKKTVAKKC